MHLEASHAFAFFDYFRVPYTLSADSVPSRGPGIASLACIRDADTGSKLWWARIGASKGVHRLGTFPIFGGVVVDVTARSWLDPLGDGWGPAEEIVDAEGSAAAHIWRSAEGDLFLPFDPGVTMECCWSERYRDMAGSATRNRFKALLVRSYYMARPLLPRALQIRLRRAFTSVQRKASFPKWPIEDGLHDLYDWLFARIVELTRGPVPWVDPWPDGRSWALVLTHDVDTEDGFGGIDVLRAIERHAGRASSWNFVPERYRIDDHVLDELREQGCEIGVHGLRHDGHDLGSRRTFEARLPAIRAYADRWDAVGFRAPGTQRVWDWIPQLGFDYDTSYPDTDPYEPTPGGSCSYFPFMNRETVELPITLPQDHTLFVILRHADASVWIDKSQHIRQLGGMALVITHPDYARDERVVDGYRRLLETFRDDGSVWWALPRDVSTWWRARAASTLVSTPEGWTIQGPAAEQGRIRFADTDGARAGGGR
jgi:hypothetical protein